MKKVYKLHKNNFIYIKAIFYIYTAAEIYNSLFDILVYLCELNYLFINYFTINKIVKAFKKTL